MCPGRRPEVRWRVDRFLGADRCARGSDLVPRAQHPRVSALSGFVVKQLMFFASYLLIVYFVTSVIRGARSSTGCSDCLWRRGGGRVLCPLRVAHGHQSLQQPGTHSPLPELSGRRRRRRARNRNTGWGSAQHSIALGAAMVMLLPLSVYLFKRSGRRIWLVAGTLVTLAALSTGSRTAAVMLIVILVCFLWLKRTEAIKMLPYLLVVTILIQGVMPGTLGTFKVILQPDYVIEEQSQSEGTGAGRLADVGPSLAEWSPKPFLGQGFGRASPSMMTPGTRLAADPRQSMAGPAAGDRRCGGARRSCGSSAARSDGCAQRQIDSRRGRVARQRASRRHWQPSPSACLRLTRSRLFRFRSWHSPCSGSPP